MTDTDLVKRIASIGSLSDAYQVLEVLMAVQKAKQDAAAWLKDCEREVIAWMKDNDVRSLDIDESKRYYIGTSKKISCRSNEKTADAVLTVCGGDLKPFCETLSSNAFKQGAVKSMVGEKKWAELYKVETVDDLKTGKAKKSLKLANDAFVVKKKA
jgi:hypothetical protein